MTVIVTDVSHIEPRSVRGSLGVGYRPRRIPALRQIHAIPPINNSDDGVTDPPFRRFTTTASTVNARGNRFGGYRRFRLQNSAVAAPETRSAVIRSVLRALAAFTELASFSSPPPFLREPFAVGRLSPKPFFRHDFSRPPRARRPPPYRPPCSIRPCSPIRVLYNGPDSRLRSRQ